MNDSLKVLLESFKSIFSSVITTQLLPVIGPILAVFIDDVINIIKEAIETDRELTTEEKDKVKAVLSSIELKAIDDFFTERGGDPEGVRQLIEEIKRRRETPGE